MLVSIFLTEFVNFGYSHWYQGILSHDSVMSANILLYSSSANSHKLVSLHIGYSSKHNSTFLVVLMVWIFKICFSHLTNLLHSIFFSLEFNTKVSLICIDKWIHLRLDPPLLHCLVSIVVLKIPPSGWHNPCIPFVCFLIYRVSFLFVVARCPRQ